MITSDQSKESVGIAGFPALLIDASLINRSDLSLAEQHALREHMSLADAVVALGLVKEEDSYAKLADAGRFDLVDVEQGALSELAARLVPERIARRYFAVPLEVGRMGERRGTWTVGFDEGTIDAGLGTIL